MEFALKKEKWQGAGSRTVKFLVGGDAMQVAMLKPAGKVLNVSIARGLPKDTRELINKWR